MYCIVHLFVQSEESDGERKKEVAYRFCSLGVSNGGPATGAVICEIFCAL
jgi:hypothetical protein